MHLLSPPPLTCIKSVATKWKIYVPWFPAGGQRQATQLGYKPCHYSTVAINSDRGRSASRASRSGFQYNTNPLCTLNALRDQTDKCNNNSIIKLYRNKYHYDKFTQLDPIFSIAARGLPLVHAFRMVKIRSMEQKYVTWHAGCAGTAVTIILY